MADYIKISQDESIRITSIDSIKIIGGQIVVLKVSGGTYTLDIPSHNVGVETIETVAARLAKIQKDPRVTVSITEVMLMEIREGDLVTVS